MSRPEYDVEIIVCDQNGEKVTYGHAGPIHKEKLEQYGVTELSRIVDRIYELEGE